MPTYAIQETVTLSTIHCAHCDILFAVPDDFERRRRQDGERFYCPSGHPNVYGKNEVDRLKRQLEVRTREATMQAERAQRETVRALRAEKKLSAVKKRVANGVCPECNRHFTNVERHMKTKHRKGTIHGKRTDGLSKS